MPEPRFRSLPIFLLAFATSSAPAAEPTQADVKFFETRVRPLLVEQCQKCHGPKKQKGGLRLDSAEALKRGGDSGLPLINSDKPDDSLLLRAVRHAEGVEKMPPESRLKDAEIADLAAWVKHGAPFPASPKPAGTDPAKHWSFQPVGRVEVPPGTGSEVDRFVQARLAAADVKPVAPADRRTLIRRATFDLTGLPPTPEEVEAYVKDASKDAFATVVDRLLASPAYGERWGRHWLDIARYADSNGLDENVAHGNAWRYRDYVIRSFNADKPYSRFLSEQIAGDLLQSASTTERNDQLIATGFLTLGPKVLAEPDEKKMELDIVDEQMDTLGRAVLGLTFGCCRCHDHKFDPFTLDDYYGLAGVFASTKTMENFTKVARWYENRLTSPEAVARKKWHEAKIDEVKERIKALKESEKEALKKLEQERAELEKATPELPTAMGASEGKIIDLPALRRGSYLTPGAVVPRRFPVRLAGANQPPLPKAASGRLELSQWLTDPKHPLTARVIVNRVWRWHFGRGLVSSVDNFGLLGQKPTHPELLDWLAGQLVADGWSLKSLHRRIMLSAVYQRSSAHDAAAAAMDPDNSLLWRAHVQRLEAESIRDALLAVSGLLDRTAGGPALTHVKNREYIFDHTSKDKTGYASRQRSVYLPVIRNNLYDVFQLFDAPDAAVPSGDRATTTVPTQALFFLNSDMAAQAADALADRVLAKADSSDAERVARLTMLAYGRPPLANEVERLLAAKNAFEKSFAAEADPTRRTRKAWAVVCQAVLASNEFIHLQ